MEMTRISEKGQVVIPKPVREQLGITREDRFLVTGIDDTVVLQRVSEEDAWKSFEKLAKKFEKVAKDSKLTRQDIINEVRAVRHEGRTRHEHINFRDVMERE